MPSLACLHFNAFLLCSSTLAVPDNLLPDIESPFQDSVAVCPQALFGRIIAAIIAFALVSDIMCTASAVIVSCIVDSWHCICRLPELFVGRR